MITTTDNPRTLLTIPEVKEMIRRVVNHQGLDAFHSDDDIRFQILQAIDVHPDGTPVTEDDVTENDIRLVRGLTNRARVTVTFGRGR